MRKVFVSLAVAVSALGVSAPATAQPQYHPPQGNAYGYHNNYGQVRALEARVQQLRQQIQRYDRTNRLSNREARRLDRHAVDLQRRIRAAASRGLSRGERFDIERRIEGLRHAIRYEVRDSNRWGWNGYDRNDNPYGYYGARHDRRDDDRRYDRDEDHRGHDRGGRWEN